MHEFGKRLNVTIYIVLAICMLKYNKIQYTILLVICVLKYNELLLIMLDLHNA
jgi:hypothetical protein